MLVGNILEKTEAFCAWQVCADRLADWMRNTWQSHGNDRVPQWEDSTMEQSTAIPGLRSEGFDNLVSVDYILKWWGGKDSETLSGELNVIWKVFKPDNNSDSFECYRTWIRLAPRDFILGQYKSEMEKREANRAAVREAFHQWQALFIKKGT